MVMKGYHISVTSANSQIYQQPYILF